VKLTPFTRQTLFFSATMPPEIKRLTEQFLQAPAKVEVARQSQAAATITQRLLKSPSSDPKTKRAVLRAAIQSAMATMKNGIVFCNRKTDVDIVAKSLKVYGFDAAPIHGDLQQSVRTATLDRFRNNELQILVASDVAARGLDIPDVSHVFNFDVPRHAEDYVHRIGRTGRAGRLGEAFMVVTPGDTKALDAVQSLIKTTIEFAEIEGMPQEKVHDDRRPAPASGSSKGGSRPRRGKPAAQIEVDTETAEVVESAAEPAEQNETAPVEATAEATGSRSRGGRNRRRTKPENRASEPASYPMAVIDLGGDDEGEQGFELLAPQDTSETPRQSRGPRDSQGRGPRGRDRNERDRNDRGDRGGRDRYRQQDQDPDVLAFGNDVPAFMKIPIHLGPLSDDEA
jgi:superfamily II DNA/RNA helicase